MEIELLYSLFRQHPTVCTDTRNVVPGSVFFALKGTNFNGNAFASQALSQGAVLAVIDEDKYAHDERFVLVEDTLQCLQELAKWHRKQLSIPVIGITGSNGKTSTKELTHAVLSKRYKAQATQGNLNNHIGVPLSILALKPETEVAIIEMGANHVGEIAFLCGIAQPTHGLITNVGKAHLEGFGGIDGVIKAKGELYDWLSAHDGCLFLQNDNKLLREMAAARSFSETITYGPSPENDVYGGWIAAQPNLLLEWKERKKPSAAPHEIRSQMTGAYNLENLLAAICVGRHLGLSPAELKEGIEAYVPSNNRSQIVKTARNTVICDYYNANASSVAAALANLDAQKAGNKVLILGDMFELGDATFEEHQKVVEQAKGIAHCKRLFVGKAFSAQKERDTEALFVEGTAQLAQYLETNPVYDALVLLKASRGMAFERVMSYL